MRPPPSRSGFCAAKSRNESGHFTTCVAIAGDAGAKGDVRIVQRMHKTWFERVAAAAEPQAR